MSFYNQDSSSSDDDIQICWQASQSNLLHQLAGTQMTRLPPPPPPPISPPKSSPAPLSRKSRSFTRDRSQQFRRTRSSRSHVAIPQPAPIDDVGTDRDDSECESSKPKRQKISKQSTELDILIEKVSARLKRERSSNSSVQECQSSYTTDSIPPQPQTSTNTLSSLSSQSTRIPRQIATRTIPSQTANQHFKAPERVHQNSNFPPQAQVRAEGKASCIPAKRERSPEMALPKVKHEYSPDTIEAKPTILEDDDRQDIKPKQEDKIPSSDGADYSCGEDFDVDILEQVCAQFD
ncbi:hypothetical protein E3Q14_02645 [Wallemia mellicola]|nr:hypothetical protein E3Q14_02645 [Wallemia mellicola]